jgi:uncharacterized protein (TIGR03083 family)
MRAPAQQGDAHDVELFREVAARFAVGAAWSHPRAPVASCPGWTVHDLVVHLGNVHAWAATVVETGRRAVEQNDEPRSGRGKVVSAWYAGKAEDLYLVLRQVDPGRPCWNFVQDDGLAAFWSRRQLHETTMHLVDLDLACGRVPSVDAAVAADGVSEVLEVWLHRMHARGHPAALEQPLALRALDTGQVWTLHPTGGVPHVQRGPATGRSEDVPDRVEAPAELLYRLLWRRATPDDGGVRVRGDDNRVRAFLGSRLTG